MIESALVFSPMCWLWLLPEVGETLRHHSGQAVTPCDPREQQFMADN
jgi:hypothetical protein